MEAKKRKIEGSGSSAGSSGRSTPSRSLLPKLEVTREQLKSPDEAKRVDALHNLKKQLSNRCSVQSFISPKEPPGLFPVIIELFIKKSMELEKEGVFPSELKNLIGILANCCYYSTLACLEMKMNHVRINHIAVKIIESPLATNDCKYSLIRLLANMCAHKETALTISQSSALLEQIGKLLEVEHVPTVVQALRCVQHLANVSFTRAVLLANIGFQLGKLVATRTGKVVEDAIAILLIMSRKYARETGRQVASSDCAEKLLELFFGGDEKVQQLVVLLCGASPDIRDKFGEKGAIQKIADDPDYHSAHFCSFLSTFAQDAWGRASLRLSGGLDVLINRFVSECPNREKMSLVLALKHFIHDIAGIAHLASNRPFVNTVIKDVNSFIEDNGTPCKPIIRNDEEIFRADSPLLMEIETHMRKRRSEEQPEQLHKDFFPTWGYSSPSPARSMSSSGNLSPPSSGAGSAVFHMVGSPESSAASSHQGERHESSVNSEATNRWELTDRTDRTIVDSELWLISWQTQEDCNLPHLIRVDLVESILNYLSLSCRPDYKVARALRRIAGFRIGLDKLLDMEFHARVLNKLCNAPCRITRNARRCARCEKCATFGKEILKEFAQHVDSDFGRSFVSQRLTSPDFEIKTRAAIAQVALKNSGTMERRLSIRVKNALEVLFSSLETYLQKENFEEIAALPAYKDGPPLCAQLIGALSTLVSANKIRKMFDVDATFHPSDMVECKVSTEKPVDKEIDDYLKFEEDGRVLAYISLEDACKNSEYFQGMFSSNMFEKTSGQRVFKFCSQAENCSSDDFTKFLHWLAGCRDECTKVRSVKTCLAMIELSDRYLCPSLADWICSPHGPTSRLINGDSLHYLFPAALTMNMHPRFLTSCFATLMRYANSDDIVHTLIAVHKMPVLHESFITKLRTFVTEV